MEEMIAVEPSLAARIVADPAAATIADTVRAAVERGESVALVGSGTSEHAAFVLGSLLAAAAPEARAGSIVGREAFAAAVDPWPGLCIAISHEGATASTAAALAAAKARGARTAQITAVPDDVVGASADLSYVTALIDTSWCHTVGYASALAAGVAIAAALRGDPLDPAGLERLLDATLERARADAPPLAARLASAGRVIPVGSGIDEQAARELALKIEEGARQPAAARETETLLHGHLAAVDRAAAAVFLVAEPREVERRTVRAAQGARAAAVLGAPVAAVLSTAAAQRWGRTPTDAGRMVLPDPSGTGIDPLAASALGMAIALQTLALALVHERGMNPDLIGREEAAHQRAADVAKEPIPA